MPLYIKDDATAALVAKLADALGTTKSQAVNRAVKAELERLPPKTPLREQVAELHARYPLPEPTGRNADKAFFDDLSGQ